MITRQRNPWLILALGITLGAAMMLLKPQQPLQATSANSNDKFSMTTVPVSTIAFDTEAVFVLDHLTGVLSGSVLNAQTGGFSHIYRHNVAADFQLNPATPEPKYSLVGGPVTMRASGGTQPANGAVYVAELTSGGVIGYGFAVPRGRGGSAPIPLVRLDGFSFREAAR